MGAGKATERLRALVRVLLDGVPGPTSKAKYPPRFWDEEARGDWPGVDIGKWSRETCENILPEVFRALFLGITNVVLKAPAIKRQLRFVRLDVYEKIYVT